ncbi:HNH endonuclease [Sphingomonas canadensis]|uniref:HNH endonuclease n=1 Tax=Sphingomonas canadensis TaxID=1219257 RepID=A0ABW3HA46_9SPHN|nr:HNH endonuclease signature motif containing protein [Sphingomonas canadensis]MCW3837825.1 HNH endonuclease [Sphingomonas canadensis]
MPRQAPRFRPPGWKPKEPWAKPPHQADNRKRGRAGQRDRATVLREEPLCRRCLERGLTAASVEVDHIVPLARGGGDERSNKQGLCKACHDAKSAEERAAGRYGPR